MPLNSPGIAVVSGTDTVTVDILQFTGSLVSVSQSDDTMVVTVDGQFLSNSFVCPTFDTDVNYKVPPLSGAYMEYSGSVVFPDSLTWYTDITKTTKIRDDVVMTRNSANFPTLERFQYYDVDGTTIRCQFFDQIFYTNNVFQVNRIRNGPYVNQLMVVPSGTSSLVAGYSGSNQVQLYALGIRSDGQTGSMPSASISWSVSDPVASSIDSSGLFSYNSASLGLVTVTASYSSTLGGVVKAYHYVTASNLIGLVMTTNYFSIKPGVTQSISVTGTWTDGIPRPINAVFVSVSSSQVIASGTGPMTADVTRGGSGPYDVGYDIIAFAGGRQVSASVWPRTTTLPLTFAVIGGGGGGGIGNAGFGTGGGGAGGGGVTTGMMTFNTGSSMSAFVGAGGAVSGGNGQPSSFNAVSAGGGNGGNAAAGTGGHGGQSVFAGGVGSGAGGGGGGGGAGAIGSDANSPSGAGGGDGIFLSDVFWALILGQYFGGGGGGGRGSSGFPGDGGQGQNNAGGGGAGGWASTQGPLAGREGAVIVYYPGPYAASGGDVTNQVMTNLKSYHQFGIAGSHAGRTGSFTY